MLSRFSLLETGWRLWWVEGRRLRRRQLAVQISARKIISCVQHDEAYDWNFIHTLVAAITKAKARRPGKSELLPWRTRPLSVLTATPCAYACSATFRPPTRKQRLEGYFFLKKQEISLFFRDERNQKIWFLNLVAPGNVTENGKRVTKETHLVRTKAAGILTVLLLFLQCVRRRRRRQQQQPGIMKHKQAALIACYCLRSPLFYFIISPRHLPPRAQKYKLITHTHKLIIDRGGTICAPHNFSPSQLLFTVDAVLHSPLYSKIKFTFVNNFKHFWLTMFFRAILVNLNIL